MNTLAKARIGEVVLKKSENFHHRLILADFRVVYVEPIIEMKIGLPESLVSL